MVFKAFVDEIVADVNTRLPELASCASHFGRFTAEEIARFAVQTPAVRVAFLGIDDIRIVSGGMRDVTVQMAMFVWTREAPQLPRDVAALAIIEALAESIPQNRWGMDCAMDPTDIQGQNLYNTQVGTKGLTVWAVSWNQVLRIGVAEDLDDDLPPVSVVPSHLYAGYVPEIGIDFEAAYKLLQGPEND